MSAKVKVTLCERAARLPRPLSLFNFTHLWFRFHTFQTVQERVFMSCMLVIWG